MNRTKLIKYRKARGLTQEQLAEQAGKSRTSITKYETGMCDIPGVVLLRLGEILHAPLAELLEKSPEEAPTHA